jgi:hypothetical protein
VSPTQYDLNFSLRLAQARIVELEQQLAVAEAEVARLRKIIHVHRVYKGFNGKVDGNDYDLWDAAGLAPYNPPDIKGDM